MKQTKRYTVFYAVLATVLLFLIVGFLIPVFSFLSLDTFSEIFKGGNLLTIIFRSIGFSLISASLCVIIGLSGALLLQDVPLFSNKGKLLTLLFIPFLLGNVTVAFIFKMALLENSLKVSAFESPIWLFSVVVLIQVWQFGSLFIYLFWLSFKRLDKNSLMFAEVSGLSFFEKFRDITLPHIKNLIVLLFLIGFVFSFYEEAKLNLIFNASPGTSSELISQWLYRNFRSDLLINFQYAAQNLVTNGIGIVFPIAILSFILLVTVIVAVIGGLTRSKLNPFPDFFSIRNRWHVPVLILLFMIITVPFFLLFNNQSIRMFDNLSALWHPFYLTIMAATFATLMAILFALFVRLSGTKLMGSFNKYSVGVLTLLFSLLLMPPIIVLISGFKWMDIFQIRDTGSIIAFWIAGHSLLSLPVLGSFVLINHFRVSSRELDYLAISKVPEIYKLRWNFMSRFKTEYLLTFLFAFSIIWNEALLNRIFSDYIPSFVSTLLGTISSRKADYSEAMSFMMVSMTISLLCVGIWLITLSKAEKDIELS